MSPSGGKRPGAGRKPLSPAGNSVTVAVAVAPDLLAIIDRMAKEAGKSRSLFITEILRAALEAEEVVWSRQ
jgi:metal-responsive CopG/Arc/MetJ family transcriptional regulator